MGQVIGDVLPLALGIAISPIPIIATILMLLSPKARSTSIGFLIGWLGGIIVAVVAFTLLSSILPEGGSGGSGVIGGIIKIVLGVLLLLLALKQWRGRPQGDAEPELPKWMSSIDSISAGRAAILAFVLAAVNPKNLLMAASGGVILGSSAAVSTTVVGTIIFVVIAASTVAAPVVAYLVASDKLAAPLESLRVWLVHNNATIMTVLLLVIGVAVIGKGIGAL